MFVGFDYGTSNCAMSWIDQGQAKLIPLYAEHCFVPSTLYGIDRGFIAEIIAQQLADGDEKKTLPPKPCITTCASAQCQMGI